ncbi:MAG: type III pantothenate kinase [Fretibacterium sp.]|nr:type III pantothenate kinase [Oscillospiraceae bacterium]MBQ9413155.1 type III pantothenate kinase [Oscillospiraceae bacterium]MBQ9526836.1 type III pantothenate kinase [Fretibacterium sp.]
MLLAIDIGNTNIVIGCIRGEELLFEARIATDGARTSDQYGVEMKNMLEAFGVSKEEVRDCIISSVVPPVFNAVRNGVCKLIGREPLVVEPGLKTGLELHTDSPAQVGADRVVIAVAALRKYAAPLILIDMGTATTMDVVEPENRYLGGVIIPGVRISLDALTGRTAQLPGINLDRPAKVVNTNTVDCMRSGIMYGAASMVDGMIDRIREERGLDYTVVATGGIAQFIIPLCRHQIALEKDLLLQGLNELYKLNAGASSAC